MYETDIIISVKNKLYAHVVVIVGQDTFLSDISSTPVLRTCGTFHDTRSCKKVSAPQTVNFGLISLLLQ